MSTRNRHYPAIQGEYEEELESEFESEYEGEGEVEGELEFEFEAEAEMEDEGELEDEYEDEDEAEGFANPIRRVYRDAETMAHLARQASLSESEGEAEAFIGALIPLASRLIPRAARLFSQNAPALVRGATRVTRTLRRNPNTRRLVRAMPVVLQRTAQSLADQAADGRPIGPDTVMDTLSRISGRVLGPDVDSALRAVDVFDRRWRRRAQRGAARRYPSPTGNGYGYQPRSYPPQHRYGRSGYVRRR
ncbi:MAG: hypothetical protein QOF88_6804 [Mycobacterium sp.]|jgi:hypothetical protein|nr:hypothetical protein [Pseudonocardiales bacterium]MDT5291915.1 hypothetical protein [Mycobacterium sp.]